MLVISALFGDQTFTNMLKNSTNLTAQVWDYAVLASYILFTILWIRFVGEMGGSASRALGEGMRTAAIGGAAASVGAKNAGIIRGGVNSGARQWGGNQVKGAKAGYAFYKSNKI